VSDSNGSFPHNADAALLLIDVINDLDFPEGDALLEQALPMARRLEQRTGPRRGRSAGRRRSVEC